MFEIEYAPKAIKAYSKFPQNIQEDTEKALEKLKDKNNWPSLKVHKLKGRLDDRYSASINYSHRIIFKINKNLISISNMGDHDIYKQD